MLDYFPKAEIVGADIELERDFRRAWQAGNYPRLTLVQGDQGEYEALDRFGCLGPYDFIIEDGSHKFEHQRLAMEVLPLYLKPGGVLFIEDVVDRHQGYHIEKYAREFKKDGLEVIFHPDLIAVRKVSADR
jgi:predicted O-methyltransferase YrrM